MADVNRGNRPLSPHLQIYRLPLTAILSILHRITGVALAGAFLLVVWWLVAGAYSAAYFATADWLLSSWLGKLVLLAALVALYLHLCNGIRHLVWDTGRAFALPVANRSNIFVIAGTIVLTVLTVIAIAV